MGDHSAWWVDDHSAWWVDDHSAWVGKGVEDHFQVYLITIYIYFDEKKNI